MPERCGHFREAAHRRRGVLLVCTYVALNHVPYPVQWLHPWYLPDVGQAVYCQIQQLAFM